MFISSFCNAPTIFATHFLIKSKIAIKKTPMQQICFFKINRNNFSNLEFYIKKAPIHLRIDAYISIIKFTKQELFTINYSKIGFLLIDKSNCCLYSIFMPQ